MAFNYNTINLNDPFNLSSSFATNPNVVGAGQAFSNSVNNAKALGNVADKAGDAISSGSKLSKGLDTMGKIAAPVQAAVSVAGLGMDIYNTIQANKQMKEQMDLARKNFNLELEKQQKQELANNELAASVDKAWGGSGKVEKTIDYSQYKPTVSKWNGDLEVDKNAGGNSLVSGGAGGQVMGENSTTKPRGVDDMPKPSTDNADLGGSGNMPTMSSAGAISPVGYSESVGNNNENEGEEESA